MKIVTVVGARPQFIKAAVVSQAIQLNAGIEECIIHTGQHFDANMSDIFFAEMAIPQPRYNLGIGGGSHASNTGRMLEAIEAILLAEKPDWVLVYGDTDSTLAGALAAAKIDIKIAHIEAGLRSFNRKMPEEINRVLTDHLAALLLAPTETALDNLSREGIPTARTHLVGDVMYDAALLFSAQAKHSTILHDLNLEPKGYLLATLHRKENTDSPENLTTIMAAFAESRYPVILPLHPRTKKQITQCGIKIPGTVKIIDPVGYIDMVQLEKNARLIATDSGGIQKEAYFHQVPCVTLREETEWVELLTIGANTLTGANTQKIVSAINTSHKVLQPQPGIYGDGRSSQKIIEKIMTYLP